MTRVLALAILVALTGCCLRQSEPPPPAPQMAPVAAPAPPVTHRRGG